MHKRIGRVLMIVIASILSLVVILLFIWAIMSPGTIRTYEGEKSLSDKFVMNINGAPNGFFINSEDTDNPVLLFVSSGPGTDDYVFTEMYENMRLEADFTVVYWDYRGMGIAYSSSINTDEITLNNILKDTQAVTQYLKERFHKEKIFIMGFSGGTHIALRAATEHPEDYYALIGMAQCVTDSSERDTLMYGFMKDVFTSSKDTSSLDMLEKSIVHLEEEKVKCNDWFEYVNLLHAAGGGTILNKTEFEGIVIPILFCKCYTIWEKINYVRGMKMYRTTPFFEELSDFDYRTLIPELSIPAYFISGEKDYNCPFELVRDYCDKLRAPDKGFFLIPNAAHSPLWENPGVTHEILREIKEKVS